MVLWFGTSTAEKQSEWSPTSSRITSTATNSLKSWSSFKPRMLYVLTAALQLLRVLITPASRGCDVNYTAVQCPSRLMYDSPLTAQKWTASKQCNREHAQRAAYRRKVHVVHTLRASVYNTATTQYHRADPQQLTKLAFYGGVLWP